MEVILAAPQCETLPSDTFISLRIGDVQKQSRLSADATTGKFMRTFKFPKPSDFRASFGRVEVYKRVGAMTVNFEAPDSEAQAVEVPCSLPDFPALQLQLSVKGAMAQKVVTVEAAEKMSRTKQRVDLAQQYLSEHNLEEVIADAMRELIRSRPTDPHAHLCNFIAQRKPGGPEETMNPLAQPLPSPSPPTAQQMAPVAELAVKPDAPKSTPEPPAPPPPLPVKEVASVVEPAKSTPVPSIPSPPQPAKEVAPAVEPVAEPDVSKSSPEPLVAPLPHPAPELAPERVASVQEAQKSSEDKRRQQVIQASPRAEPRAEGRARLGASLLQSSPRAEPTLGELWEASPQEAWDLLYSQFSGSVKPDLAAAGEPMPSSPLEKAASAPAPAAKASPAPAPVQKAADVSTPCPNPAFPQAVLEAAPTLGDLWGSCPQEAWDLLYSKFPGPVKPDLEAKGHPMPSAPVDVKSAPAPAVPDERSAPVPEAVEQKSAPAPAPEPSSSAPAPELEPAVESAPVPAPAKAEEAASVPPSAPAEFKYKSSVGTWYAPLSPRRLAKKMAAVNAGSTATPAPAVDAAEEDARVDFTTSPSSGTWMMKQRGPLRGRLGITEHESLPSVGTWCAQLAASEDGSALPQYAFTGMPSVGTWLSAAPLLAAEAASRQWFQKDMNEMEDGEVGEFVTQLQDLVSEKDKEIERLKAMLEEFERMKAATA